MKNLTEIIGAEIAEARHRRGLSQKELAVLAGVSRPDLSRLENGIGNPTLETLDRIFKVLHITLTVSQS